VSVCVDCYLWCVCVDVTVYIVSVCVDVTATYLHCECLCRLLPVVSLRRRDCVYCVCLCRRDLLPLYIVSGSVDCYLWCVCVDVTATCVYYEWLCRLLPVVCLCRHDCDLCIL